MLLSLICTVSIVNTNVVSYECMFICFIMIFNSSLTVEGTHTTSSVLWTFMQFHKLVISEITFLTPRIQFLYFIPRQFNTFRSPCCAASWSPCCAPLSGAPAVLLFLEPLMCSSFWNPCCAPLSGAPDVLLFLEPLMCSSFWNP